VYTGGLNYFVFDAAHAVALHGQSRSTATFEIDEDILLRMFNELQQKNQLVQIVTEYAEQFQEALYGREDEGHEAIAYINENMAYFEVAYITNEQTSADRVIQVKLRREEGDSMVTIPVVSNMLEPLSYPLLNPYGELQWGAGKFVCC
jgi:hypothetical protein